MRNTILKITTAIFGLFFLVTACATLTACSSQQKEDDPIVTIQPVKDPSETTKKIVKTSATGDSTENNEVTIEADENKLDDDDYEPVLSVHKYDDIIREA